MRSEDLHVIVCNLSLLHYATQIPFDATMMRGVWGEGKPEHIFLFQYVPVGDSQTTYILTGLDIFLVFFFLKNSRQIIWYLLNKAVGAI